jgi:hypothetical protein
VLFRDGIGGSSRKHHTQVPINSCHDIHTPHPRKREKEHKQESSITGAHQPSHPRHGVSFSSRYEPSGGSDQEHSSIFSSSALTQECDGWRKPSAVDRHGGEAGSSCVQRRGASFYCISTVPGRQTVVHGLIDCREEMPHTHARTSFLLRPRSFPLPTNDIKTFSAWRIYSE